MKKVILIGLMALVSGCSQAVLVKDCDPIVDMKYLLGGQEYQPAADNSEQDYRCRTKLPWE
jgi:hypothetical protein